jgi:serine/threonine protein kinase
MGVVYQAQDSKLERTVALKFLAAHLLKDEEARERFHREAKAAAALSHPNICRVHEIDEAQGRTFIAMEFVEGEDLDKRIEQGPLKIPEALDIALQIAKGLEAAHEKKIVHRDIKPGNVIVDAKGHVTVMDFGLALLTESSKLTQLDTTVGTVAYMSPEQAQGVEVDRRTDIWALGCVLYEMVCGQRPFKGLYDKALLYEIVHEEY